MFWTRSNFLFLALNCSIRFCGSNTGLKALHEAELKSIMKSMEACVDGSMGLLAEVAASIIGWCFCSRTLKEFSRAKSLRRIIFSNAP